MSIKDMFLTYVELQRSATDILVAHGPENIKTVQAFFNANQQKRKVLDAIEDIEWRMEGLQK